MDCRFRVATWRGSEVGSSPKRSTSRSYGRRLASPVRRSGRFSATSSPPYPGSPVDRVDLYYPGSPAFALRLELDARRREGGAEALGRGSRDYNRIIHSPRKSKPSPRRRGSWRVSLRVTRAEAQTEGGAMRERLLRSSTRSTHRRRSGSKQCSTPPPTRERPAALRSGPSGCGGRPPCTP